MPGGIVGMPPSPERDRQVHGYTAREGRWRTTVSTASRALERDPVAGLLSIHDRGVWASHCSKRGATMVTAPRVLVVDDDPSICEMVELLLADEGCDVQVRSHGEEALEVLCHWSVDVIVLDLHLPGMDPTEFLATCRQQVARGTPVILLSAAANLDEHAARLGVSGALAKPFDVDNLCSAIRQIVSSHDRGAASSAGGALDRRTRP
jgi:CheY-like chemotaxis protein